MTLFQHGFSILYIPSFLSYLHRNKRLLARGNKEDGKGGEKSKINERKNEEKEADGV